MIRLLARMLQWSQRLVSPLLPPAWRFKTPDAPGPEDRRTLALQTRLGNNIQNWQGERVPTLQDKKDDEDLAREHPLAIRRTGPTPFYNCHGLTFAARRTWVPRVDGVLKDDDYVPVREAETLPGDVAVYFALDTGEVDHSGVVVQEASGTPPVAKVCSKWGGAGEFVHATMDAPYQDTIVKFYRVKTR